MAAFVSVSIGTLRLGSFVRTVSPLQTTIGNRVVSAKRLQRSSTEHNCRKGSWLARETLREEPQTVVESNGDAGAAEKSSEEPDETDEGQCGLVSSSNTLDSRVIYGEFLSTMFFVLVSLMTAENAPIAAGVPNAAMVASTAAAFMPVSGAHFNPSVTVALAVTGRVRPIRAIGFIPTQIVAAITGVAIAKVLGAKVEVPVLPESLTATSSITAMFLEFTPMFIVTCVLFLTAVATEKEGGVGPKLAPMYMALSVFACICAFQPAMFNPARALALALFTGDFEGHWVYWVGPMAGAIIGSTVSE